MTPKQYIEQAIRTECDYDSAVDNLIIVSESERNMRLLHASIGLATETGEIQDAIKKLLFYNKPLDLINIQEELGDLMWYIAIMCDSLGFNLETIMEVNIGKLKARYPDKFTNDLANNRDLDKEREALERGGIK